MTTTIELLKTTAVNGNNDESHEEPETEVVDVSPDDEESPAVEYQITSYGADFDVEGLVRRLQRGDIIIPAFQRNYVWKQKEASRFIESLLLGLPVPGVFLARERDSARLLVLDGQQRLKTLQFFIEGYFNPKLEEPKRQVFKLLDVQKNFAGLTYNDLLENDRMKLDNSLIHATIIRQETPQDEDEDTSLYHIFERLNRAARLITPQEIRTAVYHGRLIDLVKELNDYPKWRSIYGKKSDRLKDQELILRFLAFYFDRSNYKSPLNEFLNKFAQKNQNPSPELCDEMRDLFESTINLVCQSIGRRAFRTTNALNAAVFDSVTVGLANRLQSASTQLSTDAVLRTYEDLLNNQSYLKSVSSGTSNEENVKERIQLSLAAFAAI